MRKVTQERKRSHRDGGENDKETRTQGDEAEWLEEMEKIGEGRQKQEESERKNRETKIRLDCVR